MRIYPISECFLISVPFQIFIKKRFTTLLQKPTISISYQTLVKKYFLREQIKCKRKKKSTKEKKIGIKEERKLTQRERSSAKETGER